MTELRSEQSFAYEIRRNSAVIWRCFSRDTRAEIPPFLDGYPVTEIAPYGFSAHMEQRTLEKAMEEGRVKLYLSPFLVSEFGNCSCREQTVQLVKDGKLPVLCGNSLEEISFPESVHRVGRYCFYNCSGLKTLEFSGGVSDWGSGVFTGCHQVNKMTVFSGEDGKTYLKDVLDEVREELEVELICGDRKAVLMFPEFYEEGVENTPARILETHVHGSGIFYRNCFRDRIFDFRQYDLLFPHAKALESPRLLARLTMGRLRHPVGLLPEAEKQYVSYVKDHEEEIGRYLLEQRDMEGIRWLLFLEDNSEQLLEFMTEEAARLQYGEALSYLMNCGRSRKKTKRRRLEL